MDGALKTMDGLALIKQVKNFRAEYWVAEIVTEIKGAEQFAQRVTGFVDGIAGGGGAEAVECLRRRVSAVPDRSTEPKKPVPAPPDGAAGHSFGDDRLQDLRNAEPFWLVEPAFLQPGQSRTQIEADGLGERHCKMCEAMRVDRDPLELINLTLAQGAFDSSTGLPAV